MQAKRPQMTTTTKWPVSHLGSRSMIFGLIYLQFHRVVSKKINRMISRYLKKIVILLIGLFDSGEYFFLQQNVISSAALIAKSKDAMGIRTMSSYHTDWTFRENSSFILPHSLRNL